MKFWAFKKKYAHARICDHFSCTTGFTTGHGISERPSGSGQSTFWLAASFKLDGFPWLAVWFAPWLVQLKSNQFLLRAAKCLISRVVNVVNWTWFLLLVGECSGSFLVGFASGPTDLFVTGVVLSGRVLHLLPRVAVFSVGLFIAGLVVSTTGLGTFSLWLLVVVISTALDCSTAMPRRTQWCVRSSGPWHCTSELVPCDLAFWVPQLIRKMMITKQESPNNK